MSTPCAATEQRVSLTREAAPIPQRAGVLLLCVLQPRRTARVTDKSQPFVRLLEEMRVVSQLHSADAVFIWDWCLCMWREYRVVGSPHAG